MEKPVVLIVEDDRLQMWCMQQFIKQLNLTFISADTGEKALRLVENISPRCMLLDINLGEGISGIELMETLRLQPRFRDTPIVAVSAYYTDGTHPELLQKGFTDYIPKPFSFDHIEALLKKHGIID